VNESLTACWQSLIIASESTEPDEPAQGPLDDPAFSLDLKTALWFGDLDGFSVEEDPVAMGVIVLMRNNLKVPSKVLFDPLKKRPCVSTVSEQMRNPWQASVLSSQEQGSRLSIRKTGSVNVDDQREAQRVKQQMTFATPDFPLKAIRRRDKNTPLVKVFRLDLSGKLKL